VLSAEAGTQLIKSSTEESVKMQRIKVLIKEKAKTIPKVPICMNDFKHEDGCL
jgi:hypothetical protein